MNQPVAALEHDRRDDPCVLHSDDAGFAVHIGGAELDAATADVAQQIGGDTRPADDGMARCTGDDTAGVGVAGHIGIQHLQQCVEIAAVGGSREPLGELPLLADIDPEAARPGFGSDVATGAGRP